MSDTHQFPDGRLKNTGAELFDSVARVLIHDRVGHDDGQLTITVEHPAHDRGVRAFWRYPGGLASTIQSHLDKLAGDDIKRVEIHDIAGVGLTESEVLPTSYTREGPFATKTPEVAVVGSQ